MHNFEIINVKSLTLVSLSAFVLLLVAVGFIPVMNYYAFAVVTDVTINEPLSDTTVGPDFSTAYVVTDSGSNTASAGTITFTRTGGTPDAASHVYPMVVPFDTSTSVHTINRTTLEADVGFAPLIDGSVYTIDISITDGIPFTDQVLNVTMDFLDAVVTNTSNTKSSGKCDGDCEEPTLGVDSRGKRLVSNGFTYNEISVDVERFFTPYPLIQVNVGEENRADFKIYDNMGPEKIKHFSFAFGLGKDQVISQSKAMIELDIDFNGKKTVTLTDPENVLDDVRVKTNIVSCDEDKRVNCLAVTIYHTFRAPLDFNIVATDVWDSKRNAWQNYYNHGIEVVGESLNPPREYDGINRGTIYHLTETSKTTAVDEFGNSWTLKYDKWYKDYVVEKVQDTGNVNSRNHSAFSDWKQEQAEMATSYFDSSKIQGTLDDPFRYEYPTTTHREQTLQTLNWHNSK